MNRFLIFAAFALTATGARAQTHSVKDYVALNDGKTLATGAIQKAIDACNRGGGMVKVPAGTYLTGTINLKTNVNLHLSSGAVLKGNPNLGDYQTYSVPTFGINHYGILYTANSQNVALTGHGAVDGNNEVFYDFTHAKTIDTASKRSRGRKTTTAT